MKTITTITGRIGKAGRVFETKAGKLYASFPVAVNGLVDGQKTTTWYTCNTANQELFSRLDTGKSVRVAGRLVETEYTGKDGAAKTNQELWAFRVELDGEAPAAGMGVAA